MYKDQFVSYAADLSFWGVASTQREGNKRKMFEGGE